MEYLFLAIIFSILGIGVVFLGAYMTSESNDPLAVASPAVLSVVLQTMTVIAVLLQIDNRPEWTILLAPLGGILAAVVSYFIPLFIFMLFYAIDAKRHGF